MVRTFWIGGLLLGGLAFGDTKPLLGSAFELAWADKALAPVLTSQYAVLAPTSTLDWAGDEDWATWVLNVQALGLPYRGPRLAGGLNPLRLAALDAKSLEREFTARVKTLRSQTKAAPLSWDAASGIFTASGAPADSPFRKVWGADWPARALLLASQADPGTPLFLAEDDTLGLNPRSDALYRLASELKSRGLPLAGVALGARQRVSFRSTGLEVGANLQRFADLGLSIHVVDWDFGLDQDQSIPDRAAVAAQSTAYQETLSWMLAVPAVKLISVAEPTDRYARPRGGIYAAPSLVSASGVPKSVLSALGALLRKDRPAVRDLATDTVRQSQVPIEGAAGPGLPTAWDVTDVWHLLPATEESPPGGEFRHRATFYRNIPAGSKAPGQDDFGMFWYLSWTEQGLVFQVERSDDQVLAGNRGESVWFEVRGPGFASSRELMVGSDFSGPFTEAAWTGKTLKAVFHVPPEAGWGPGTLLFFRFSGTDNDAGDQGLTLDPWPTLQQGAGVPWKAFRIVKPLS